MSVSGAALHYPRAGGQCRKVNAKSRRAPERQHLRCLGRGKIEIVAGCDRVLDAPCQISPTPSRIRWHHAQKRHGDRRHVSRLAQDRFLMSATSTAISPVSRQQLGCNADARPLRRRTEQWATVALVGQPARLN
jgi:hypothetical protein